MNHATSGARSSVLLSPQQKRMILLHEIDPDNVAYNTGAGFRWRGRLDPERLFRAITAVVQAHRVLRTAFALEGGVPCGWLRPEPTFEWELVDERRGGRRVPEHEVVRELRYGIDGRMDLVQSSLRVRLVRLADDDALLSIVMHHVVCDGWSFAVLLDEICAEYEAAPAAARAQRSTAFHYDEYAAWFARKLEQRSYAADVEYFKNALSGAPLCLELPWDRARPALQSYRGQNVVARLPPELVAEARLVAERQQATPFLVFFTAFVLLLRRYSGQRDTVVGVPVANRERSEMARSLGFFVNTLPLRSVVDDDATFVELLASTRATLLDALDHQSAQIEDIVEALRLPRDASYPPLYQAMFAYQNAPAPKPKLSGATLESVLLGTVGAKCDLTLNLDAVEDTLQASFEYNADLFEHETVVRFADAYACLLARLLETPERPLREIDVVPPAEREKLVELWNSAVLPTPATTVIAWFRAQVERTPDARAVQFRDQSLSYAELNELSLELAAALVERGVRRHAVVGVLAERGLGMVAALLAVWQLGATYVPLDPAYPADRLEFMLADSGASAVLVDGNARGVAIPPHVAVVSLEAPGQTRATACVPSDAAPTDLAYIIYTSGSTGRPKGVCIEQRSVVAFLAWAHAAYSRAELARVLASTSICFDLSVFELFVPLTCGGTAVVVRDALELAELDVRPDVTLLNVVHSALAELLRVGAVPPSVRVVNFGGELPSNDTAQRAYALPHVEHVYNVYGPTEDTVYSMSFRIERGSTAVPAIGTSIPNSQAYVLDDHGKLVPIGVTGELYLAGDGLARCYHARPELTAERFVEIDVGRKVRAYRTGDLARRRANGVIDFLGRRDHQVKVRGYRVELGEIDQALLRCDGVRDAVAATWAEPGGELALVGYFVASGPAATPDAIRSELGRWLPAYMIPSHFVELPELPHTPNGKVARNRLPPPPVARGSGSELRDGSLEPVVARVFEELLGARAVGAEDEFFALGGHSLLAARVAARLAGELGVEVGIRDLFRFPRVRALAAELTRRSGGRERPEVARSSALELAKRRVELAEFAGYHVNCFVHCIVQAGNFFKRARIHDLNEIAAAFLPHRFEYRELDPGAVPAATLYREIKAAVVSTLEERLCELFGLRATRFCLEANLLPLREALAQGAFPILVGGTELIVEPSMALVACDSDAREFVALGNDFGVAVKTVPFDSPRLRPGQEVLLIQPPSHALAASEDVVAGIWQAQIAVRRSSAAGERRAFAAWHDKYAKRTDLPESELLRVELEGVNVTIGSEIGGYLRFERHLIERLPARLRTDAVEAHARLLDRTLAEDQHVANVLRRALLKTELPPPTLNAKIVEAIASVAERQRLLARSFEQISPLGAE